MDGSADAPERRAGRRPADRAASARPSSRARSTRPSSTRPSCASSSACCVLMRSPVRGGLKGGRRSVKRGQSVEFADYRDYALGDDLRQLDWNVYARLERLFVKLFIEEEDVTVTLLVDASASMAAGRPAKLLFAKRAAAALGYIGLASEDRVDGQRPGRPGRAAARRDARLRPRLPAAVRPVGDRAGRRPDRPASPPPATPPPSSTARAS